MNAVGFGFFGKGEEQTSVEYMTDLWMNMETNDLWTGWGTWNPLSGLTSYKGFLNNEPMFKYLQEVIGDK